MAGVSLGIIGRATIPFKEADTADPPQVLRPERIWTYGKQGKRPIGTPSRRAVNEAASWPVAGNLLRF